MKDDKTPTINTGLGSTAETNRLLGGNFYDVNTGASIKPFSPDTTNSLPDFVVPKKDTIPSSSLTGGQSVYDLVDRRNKLQSNVLSANLPSRAEQNLTEQFNQQKQLSRQAQLALNRESERLQTEGKGLTQGIAQNFLSETGRRFTSRMADIGIAQSGVADALQAEIAKRTANVDFATGLLNADKENILLLQDLQKATVPDVLSTQVNDMTGDVTAFTQDPTTGTITSNVIGNVGAKKQYAQSGTYQDASGNQVFWGLSPTGQIETKNLGGGGGIGGGGGGLTPYQQFQATQSIAKDTQARTENAREMARQASLIEQSYQNIVGGRDRSLNTQAIITSFNKILDPTSVVRESEYDRTAQGQSLINRLQGKYDNIIAGGAGVTEATLKEASEIAKMYLEGAKNSINLQNKRAEEMATQFGLNPEFVTSSYKEQPIIEQPIAPEKESIFNSVVNQAQDNKKSFGQRFLDLFR